VFWKRANGWGASLGMLAGLGITAWYMVLTQPWLRGVFGISGPIELWFGIRPIAAGVFGVPLGLLVIFVVSWITPRDAKGQALVEQLRYPNATRTP
jgi:cation/acetate symporter